MDKWAWGVGGGVTRMGEAPGCVVDGRCEGGGGGGPKVVVKKLGAGQEWGKGEVCRGIERDGSGRVDPSTPPP
jgi:hypothetical protein